MAQLSFITTLWLPYQGEEAVYTITSMEMAARQEWIAPLIYGENYAIPPFFNWLIIPLAECFGWQHVLVISRVFTLSTMGLTSLLLIEFVHRISRDRLLAIFSGLIFVSWDTLFRRGWLAYADPLFSLWIFSAIAFLWLAVKEEKLGFLILAILNLIASYLTKAITGYVFYGLTAAVLIWRTNHKAFFLRKSVWILHAAALLFPELSSLLVGTRNTRSIFNATVSFHFDRVGLLDFGTGRENTAKCLDRFMSLYCASIYLRDLYSRIMSSIIRGIIKLWPKIFSALTRGRPLYSDDHSAVGLSFSTVIDAAWMPQSWLVRPALSWENGYVLSRLPNMPEKKIKKIYHLGTHPLYLLCRGVDCQ